MKRVAILISGGGSNMVRLLEYLEHSELGQACIVISNDASAGGLAKAARMGIETAVVDHRPFGSDRAGFEGALQTVLQTAQADLICLAGFMRVLTGQFTDRWADAMLNIHPSLLPLHKGLNTHQRAIDAGDELHGCTVHLVTSELDDGPMLGQAHVPVLPGDTAAILAQRVLVQEHRLYPMVLDRFLRNQRDLLVLD